VLATGLLLSWLVMLFLLLGQGASLKQAAIRDGRYARLNVRTGTVEGNILTLTPPPAPPPVAETPTISVPEVPVAETPTPATEAPPVDQAAAAPPSPPPASMGLRAPLNPAPNTALVENVGPLALPKPSAEGVTPAEYYKKPFMRPKGMPLVAVLVRDLGLQPAQTEAAMGLDEYVTLGFSPYTPRLNAQAQNARAAGHEFWLQVPMEPEGYPANDAGPFALLRTDSAEANLSRLHQVMGTATGYAGLIAPPAELFSSGSLMGDLAEDIRARGLLLLQHQPVTLLPRFDGMTVPVSRTVAPETTPEQLRPMLSELEAMARTRGYAVLSLPPTPGLLAELPAWLATLPGKNIVLAPLSALAVAKEE
jgi:polysaccharide deacetylase 2 family uncharacterized protein YibQ